MSLSKRLIAGGAADVGYQGGAFEYTGGGTTDRTIDVGFEPDLAIIHPKGGVSQASSNSYVIDRDILGRKNFMKQSSSWIKSSSNCFTWNSTGFDIHYNSETQYAVNNNAQQFTGYCFKTSDTGVTNTDGSLTSTVWANPDFGISKIKFNGNGTTTATFGHGLGTTPQYVIIALLEDYTSGTGSKGMQGDLYRYHNEGSQQEWRRGGSTNSRIFSGPAENVGTWTANSSTITVDNQNPGGKTSNTYICIAFASASGFCKYQSYTGNGSTSTRTILSADFDPSSIFILGNLNTLWLDESFRTSGTDLPRWDSGDVTNVYQESSTFNLTTGEYIRADWRTNKRVLLNTDTYACNTNGDRNGVIAFGGDNWNPVP